MPKLRDSSREQLALLINSVKEYAIYMLDKDGRIISWNKGAERLKGYTREEVLGKHFSLFYTHADQKKQIPQNLLRFALKHGQYTGEGFRVKKDGTLFWASVAVCQ